MTKIKELVREGVKSFGNANFPGKLDIIAFLSFCLFDGSRYVSFGHSSPKNCLCLYLNVLGVLREG